MTYWLVDQVNGSDVERWYGAWEGRQQEFHDWVELGERAALALAAENPPRESGRPHLADRAGRHLPRQPRPIP